MADILCPHDLPWNNNQESLAEHGKQVSVFNNICERSQICPKTDCQFYDASPEALKKFMDGLNQEETLERVVEQRIPKTNPS